jgi:ABC-type lipoprotein export system ATPase subunit
MTRAPKESAMIGHWLRRTRAATQAPPGPGSQHLIELRKVVKTYTSAAGSFTALHGIDLVVEAGEFVAVIGKSGSGKSTLINTITGIDRPSSGEVLVGGAAVHTLGENQLAQWRGRTIGIVFQFFQLLPTLTIIENVMLPMDFCDHYTPRERHERAMQLLEQVEMAEHAHKLPSAVSGGQQQRVAIARALANDPPIIVADEPTGNLDSKTAEAVFRLFERLVDQGKTILMVTHDQDLARRVTRTVIIADGQVIDEYLARALLIAATRQLEARTFAPGAVIMREGETPDNFYLVTSGRVEVVLHDPGGHEIVVAAMGPGQYFGEIELLRGGPRIATIRAAEDTGVEVAALDRQEFAGLVGTSAQVKAAIDRIATERTAENAAAREEEVAAHG